MNLFFFVLLNLYTCIYKTWRNFENNYFVSKNMSGMWQPAEFLQLWMLQQRSKILYNRNVIK